MMERRRGHIVCLSSMSALHPMPGAVIYSATKFAVQGFVEALSEELRQEGYGDCLHFTSVHPYFVSTRKDLMKAINLRFPAISAEHTAKCTVDAMLRNERSVVMPEADRLLTKLLRCLPIKAQHVFRDHVLRERETKRMFIKERNT